MFAELSKREGEGRQKTKRKVSVETLFYTLSLWTHPIPNSSQLVLPISLAPAFLSLLTAVASKGEVKLESILEEAVVGMSFVQKLFFIEIRHEDRGPFEDDSVWVEESSDLKLNALKGSRGVEEGEAVVDEECEEAAEAKEELEIDLETDSVGTEEMNLVDIDRLFKTAFIIDEDCR